LALAAVTSVTTKSIDSILPGCYLLRRQNLFCRRSSGTGATFDTTRGRRGLEYAGNAIADAANVAVTNNISGNIPVTLRNNMGSFILSTHQTNAPYDEQQHPFQKCRISCTREETVTGFELRPFIDAAVNAYRRTKWT
jgi:hypothetical protein